MNNDFLPRRGSGHASPRNEVSVNPRPGTFETPEVIANHEHEAEQPGADSTAPVISHHGTPPKRSLKDRLKAITKKQWIIIGVVAVILLGGIGFGVYQVVKKDPVKAIHKETAAKVVPAPAEPITSTLTGLPITDPSVNDLPVTAIMIENSQDARPQSGLNQAGVVFEAVAEGGITRFLTLWQDSAPDYVGPVRSVRPYYLQWLQGFDASVAHVGGSADALKLLKQWGISDLDQFYNTAPYWRVSNRFAPHNMYTSLPKLHELEAKKGIGKSNYSGFARKKEAPSPTPPVKSIDFNISGAIYNSHYDYDSTTNTYKRSEGGKPQTDERSGTQLAPKVVIGLVMPQGSNGIYTTYNTLGSGAAFVFQDGYMTKGTWTKTDNKTQFTFKDASGAELKLNPGQTWLTVLGGENRVTYAP